MHFIFNFKYNNSLKLICLILWKCPVHYFMTAHRRESERLESDALWEQTGAVGKTLHN